MDNNPKGSLFVGEGVVVKGTFEVPEMAVVAGLVEGELNTKEVLVDATGIVNGRINAEVVEIRGEVTQGLHVTNHLNIKSSAKITDRKSTRLNSSHIPLSRMPSSA